ncbi:FGGY-family carbohydrate kinase [Maricaulis parjimensis]|uniref:FGGY-family carbohydrate kinase n=1 Tax=Maricaulis parjimensis TaxID=144023 RepID=UPI00193A527E|nr:FGGY family carbohydrate kinase [Maricaulis parjimensis]
MKPAEIIVLDVGKTLSKLSAWTSDGELVERAARPNASPQTPHYRALDTEATFEWVVETLTEFSKRGPIRAIIPVCHGASAALVRDGQLVAPPMDYEQPVPDAIREAYWAERDPFAVNGSPSLPDGLNLGTQLFWLQSINPGLFDAATIMPLAQFWAWRLSGVATSEVTSLGCHTDLWSPAEQDFSPMAKRLGWAEKFAPLARAGDVIGRLSPDLAAKTGLSERVEIHCGLHDSNAALVAARGFPEIADADCTILSTGTWFVAMRSMADAFDPASLEPGRDCLINVDIAGRPVPSARFMGGREIETLIGIDTRRVDIKPDQPEMLASVAPVIANEAMLLPTFAPGFGPFPETKGTWLNQPDNWFQRRAAACLYAAMVMDESLDLIGARGTLLVEGRFAEAEVFVRGLARLRPDMKVYTTHAHNDVSFGALRLLNPDLKPATPLSPVRPLEDELAAYQTAWRDRVNEQGVVA